MACIECDTDDAALVEIEYTDGRSEELALCTECRSAYEDGGFVETTTVVEP